MATRDSYVLTFTGITGQERERLKAIIAGLRACEYSGSLIVGSTTHLVVPASGGEEEVAALVAVRASAKFRLARAAGIPIVAAGWLEDSRANGFLLSHARYLLHEPASPKEERRLTSESVSAPLRPPSVEKLRRLSAPPPGEFLAASPRGADLSPLMDAAAAVLRPSNGQRPTRSLCYEALPELPSSPPEGAGSLVASLLSACDAELPGHCPEGARSVSPADPPFPSFSHLGLPSPAASGGLRDLDAASPPASILVGLQPSGGRSCSPAVSPAGPSAAAGSSRDRCAAGCTPAASPAAGQASARASRSGGSTDSETRLGRLLSRISQLMTLNTVTVRRRCRGLRARRLSSPAAAPTSQHGYRAVPSRDDGGGQLAERPAAAAAALQRLLAGQEASSHQHHSAGGQGALGAEPSWEDAAGRAANMQRFEPTTTVLLGRKAPRPPGRHILDGLLEHHGLASLADIQFFSSAQLWLADGRALVFEAGDTAHGARMVYDVHADGAKQYAQALVCAIYTLPSAAPAGAQDGAATAAGTSAEVWFAHKYFLGREDLQERPLWRGFLKEAVVRPDELLLALGTYHSPLNLVEEEFGVAFTGHCVLKSDPLPAPRRALFPLLECRRGFDTARGTGVPLRRALREVQ